MSYFVLESIRGYMGRIYIYINIYKAGISRTNSLHGSPYMNIIWSPNLHFNPSQSSISVSCYYYSGVYTPITDSFTDWPKQCNRNKTLVLYRMLCKQSALNYIPYSNVVCRITFFNTNLLAEREL